MAKEKKHFDEIPLFISRSSVTTEVNRTGSWRFLQPRYDEKTAPCSVACPAGEDISRIELLANQGLFKEAIETILKENPFPGVCGRICFHPCENACNRAELDEPVAIHCLERFLGDRAFLEGENLCIDRFPANGKKVAIIGAGPAGLSCAWFLTRLGFSCDVFEAKTEPGGVLRWGIPCYRLPGDVLEKEIKRIENQGVKIHCGTSVNGDFLKDFNGRYDAVFIGCGHSRSLSLKISGEEMAYDGLAFLNKIREDKVASIKGTAAVIGGGNTAIDAARSLVRLGADTILVYRRRKQDMPAFDHEVEMALREGVQLMELVSPIGIEENSIDKSSNYPSYYLTLQKMKICDQDTKGRQRVIPDGTRTEKLRAHKIFIAIGADVTEPWQIPGKEIAKILNLSHCTLAENDLPVVYGGDVTNHVKSVPDAIASGKQAAMALDIFFKEGWNAIENRLASCLVGTGPSLSMEIYTGGERKSRNSHVVSYEELNVDYFELSSITIPVSLFLDESIKSFAEIEQTLSMDLAIEEVKRCFNCGLCNECDNCRLFCPEIAVLLEDTRHINLDYCKGCGICVVECPRNAMALEEEKT